MNTNILNEESNTLTENLIRIRDAANDMRNSLDMPDASIEDVAIKVSTIMPVKRKEVNFFTHLGDTVYSYTKDEFLALTIMPDTPVLDGFVSQGWNWELISAQNYVRKYGRLEIGNVCITNDGKTHIWINIDNQYRTDPYFKFNIPQGATIDWGDGTTEILTKGSAIIKQHIYPRVGIYNITIDAPSITLTKEIVYGGPNANDRTSGVYKKYLERIDIGNNVSIAANSEFGNPDGYIKPIVINFPAYFSNGDFDKSYCFSRIVAAIVPTGVTSLNGTYSCSGLLISLPSTITTIGSGVFYNGGEQGVVCLPDGITTVGSGQWNKPLQQCLASYIIIPDTVTTMLGPIEYCSNLKELKIPDGVTTVNNGLVPYAKNLMKLEYPKTLTNTQVGFLHDSSKLTIFRIPSKTIKINNCNYLCSLKLFDCSMCEQIPTLDSYLNDLANDCQIVVPDDLYEDWKATTRWSDFTSRIVSVSNYNGDIPLWINMP